MVFERIIGRLTQLSSQRGNLRSTRKHNRRRMQVERMERRELLANDLAAISGVSFDDLNGDGTCDIGTEPLTLGVDVFLYRDSNSSGTYEAGIDVLAGSDTDGDGSYRFPGLDGPDNDNPGDAIGSKNPDGVGRYFIVQDPGTGRRIPDPVAVNITDDTGVQLSVIDDYSATGQNVGDSAGNGSTTDFEAAPEVIGGFRDIEVLNNAAGGEVRVIVDAVSDQLSIGSQGVANGSALIQYDGGGNSIDVNPTGLETAGVGVSLGGGAPGDPIDPDAGFIVQASTQDAGDTLTVRVYSNGNMTTAEIDLDDETLTEQFVRFSDFSPIAGIDFNDVGAIEAFVTLANDNDVVLSIVETRRPNVETMNVPNVIPLSLGGTLFFDDGGLGPVANQNNGLRESNEAAIVGVTVELYELQNAGDTVDLTNPATTPLNSQTTTGNQSTLGFNYNFTDLDPGFYAVVVPANQFSGGAILTGYANSTGNDPAPDPDDDIDDDDNGIVLTGTNTTDDGAVFSQTITLASNTEPTADDINGADNNSNTTLDFGFYPQIDLGVTKTLDTLNSNLSPGGDVVFSFVVQNNGPLNATDVEVLDVFPAGLIPTGIANNPGGFTLSTNGNEITVNIGNIPSTTQVTFDLTADIAANQFTDVINPASVSGRQIDINAANDTSQAAVDLPQADLEIDKSALQNPATAGGPLTYEITVFNDGPDAAAGVVVSDTLPASVQFVSGNVDGGSNPVIFDSGTGVVTATVGPLANQATSIITILVTVDPDSPTPIQNNASVVSTPNTDPDPTNNSTSLDTDINRVVDVEIDKTASGSVIAGEVATYTVVVTNNGPGQARGIEVTDILDDDLTLVANSFDPGNSSVTLGPPIGQILSFDVGVLDVDESVSFSFDVTIDSGATGTIPNTAVVTTTDTDNVPGNNSDPADIIVDQAVDLVLTKSVDLQNAVPGDDQLVYTFVVSHDPDSPSDATGVTVTDTLPAGVTFVGIDAATADASSFTNGVVTVVYDSLPVGGTETFTVTVNVNEDATGSITNPASVARERNRAQCRKQFRQCRHNVES